MEEKEKNDLYVKYSKSILASSKTFRKKCEFLESVKDFIDNSDSYTMKGYRSYCKATSTNATTREAVLDFLAFIGNKERKIKVKKEKSLEKLAALSEKNKKLVDDYAKWLYNEFDFSPNTSYSYIFTVKNFFLYANEFNMENAKRYIRSLEEQQMKPRTINLRITGLEKFSEFLKKPIKMKRPKIIRSLDTNNIPTESEYNRLLEFLSERSNKDHYYWIKILATTGARISEFLKFNWEDVLNGDVVLKGKGSKYRRFFFSKSLQDEVRGYVKANNKTGPIARGKFGVITSRGFASLLKGWGNKCDIDSCKMHPHAFRHFFAKMFLKRNKDVVQLAEIMGHGSIDTTRIYLQKSYAEQKRDFNRNVTW